MTRSSDTPRPELVLASQSPRRRELLALLGHEYRAISPDVDETAIAGETPEQHVSRLSELKARTVGESLDKAAVVIGSDTIVALDGAVLEKPESAADAVDMLMRLQGRAHTVYTGIAVYDTVAGDLATDYESTAVTMREFGRELAERYVATGEPMDKAGAYGIQGYGSVLVTAVNGCYFTVMGLPLAKLMCLLHSFTGGQFDYFGPNRSERML